MTEPHPTPLYDQGTKLEYVDPTQIPQWNQWLDNFETSTIFHTSNWAKVLSESYGYIPRYLVCNNTEIQRAIFPMMEVQSVLTGRRGVSLPFSDFCQPLLQPGISLIDLFDRLKKVGASKKWQSIMLRDVPHWTEQPFKVIEYLDHTIDLNRSSDALFSALRTNYRRKIKKARGNELEIKFERSFESMKAYYELHCLTRKKHELPPQPFRFFKKIHEHILSKELGFIIIAYHKGEAIAGAVYMHFGKHVIYKYGGSNSTYDHLNGNYLVQWSGIEWAAQNGFDWLSLGRTDPENKGLIQYKNGWASSSRPLAYYKFDLGQEEFINNKGKLLHYATHLFKRMPLPVLKMAGSFLYPHIG